MEGKFSVAEVIAALELDWFINGMMLGFGAGQAPSSFRVEAIDYHVVVHRFREDIYRVSGETTPTSQHGQGTFSFEVVGDTLRFIEGRVHVHAFLSIYLGEVKQDIALEAA